MGQKFLTKFDYYCFLGISPVSNMFQVALFKLTLNFSYCKAQTIGKKLNRAKKKDNPAAM